MVHACQENKSSSALKLYKVQAIGETIHDQYVFCSSTPVYVDYSYRNGLWKLLTDDSIKIAEGTYDVKVITIDSIGGCEYSFKENMMDTSKWTFWDLKGNEVKPTKKFLNIIESTMTEFELTDMYR